MAAPDHRPADGASAARPSAARPSADRPSSDGPAADRPWLADPGSAGEAPPPGYTSTAEYRSRLDALVAGAGGRVTQDVLGHTVEGRPIPVLHIGAPGGRPDPARPQALVLGGIHGCEVIATELALDVVAGLAAPAPTGRAAEVRDVADVVAVPMLNIDGRVASLRSLGRRRAWNPAPRRNAHGVDLNRNWPFPEGVVDSWLPIAGTPISWLPWYRGPMPLSEPETRALAALADEVRPFALLNLHSTGSILTHPWSSKPEVPADLAGWQAMIAAFNDAQPTWTYRSKQSRAWYPILGSSNDWFYDRFGTLAMTVEVSPPAAEVRADAGKARWFFWYANPVDRQGWVDNDRDGCLAALVAAHDHRHG